MDKSVDVLISKIVLKRKSQQDCATQLGISYPTWVSKMKDLERFTVKEVRLLSNFLSLDISDVELIFFNQEVA